MGNTSKDQKVYKIKYTLNLLPTATYTNGVCLKVNELMDSLVESNEFAIFDSKIVKDFYDFHWNSYAKHMHYFGAVLHFAYVALFTIYVNEVYLHRRYKDRIDMCWLMLICIIFPLINDSLQLKN